MSESPKGKGTGLPWAQEKKNNERINALEQLQRVKAIEKQRVEAGTHVFMDSIDKIGKPIKLLTKIK